MRREDNIEKGMHASFIEQIKTGKWRIDKGLIQYLTKHGDSETRFDLLTSSLYPFLTTRQKEFLFLKEFDLRKKDDWSMMVLSELLYSIVLGQQFPKRKVEKFRKYIHYFATHRSYKLRRFGIMSAVRLEPPEREHFSALKAGLFHRHDSMRLYCMTALGTMFHTLKPLPKSTIETIRSIRLVKAVKRFVKSHPEFHSNVAEMEPYFQKYQLEV